MKRIVIALTATAMTVAGAGVASAKPDKGNGAQKAGLAAASGLAPVSCTAAKGAGKQTPTGFAVLNAPGKPGSPKKIVGEVAVKDAEPGTYDLRLAGPKSDGTGCGTVVGQLVVGENRHGNASIAAASQGEGAYYVVLTRNPLPQLPVSLVAQEHYASAPVTLR